MKLKIIIPFCICVIGVLMLMGCIYIPIPEHPVDKTQKDFRPLLGDETKPGPLHLGITRQQVVALLGEPTYVQTALDGVNAVYFIDTEEGYTVSFDPTCFGPYQLTMALVVVYDPAGIVRKLERERCVPDGSAIASIPHFTFSQVHERYLNQFRPFFRVDDDYVRWVKKDPATQP